MPVDKVGFYYTSFLFMRRIKRLSCFWAIVWLKKEMIIRICMNLMILMN